MSGPPAPHVLIQRLWAPGLLRLPAHPTAQRGDSTTLENLPVSAICCPGCLPGRSLAGRQWSEAGFSVQSCPGLFGLRDRDH